MGLRAWWSGNWNFDTLYVNSLTKHQGVYWDPKEGPLLYYHYVDTRIGYGDGQKKFGVNKINWSSGWPVV